MVFESVSDRLRRIYPRFVHGCRGLRFNHSPKMGWLSVSFDIDMGDIMQFGFNIFGSFLPVVYLFIGAAFAIFVIFAIINRATGRKE